MFEDANNGKVIVLDMSIFWHSAIFAKASALRRKQTDPSVFIPSAPKLANTMIISALNKIGVDKNDIIIGAVDSLKGSWRKQYFTEYKADRKELKAKTSEETGLIWSDEWAGINKNLEYLKRESPINFVDVDHMEADDIAATVCKYYTDKLVVLVSFDSDWQYLWHYNNVRIFSIKRKEYPYIIKPSNFDPYKKMAKEIAGRTHNNLGSTTMNEHDYEVKKLVIDLINLPSEITEPIIDVLKTLEPNHGRDLSHIRGTVNHMGQIYEGKRIISYEKCLKHERKK